MDRLSSRTLPRRTVHWPPASPVVPLQDRFEEDVVENEPVFQASLKKQLSRYEYYYGPQAYSRLHQKRRSSQYELEEHNGGGGKSHRAGGASFDEMIREKIDAQTLQSLFKENIALGESKPLSKRSVTKRKPQVKTSVYRSGNKEQTDSQQQQDAPQDPPIYFADAYVRLQASQEQRYIPFKSNENNEEEAVTERSKSWKFIADKIVEKNPRKFKELMSKVKDRELIKRFVAKLERQKQNRNRVIPDMNKQKESMVSIGITPINVKTKVQTIENKTLDTGRVQNVDIKEYAPSKFGTEVLLSPSDQRKPKSANTTHRNGVPSRNLLQSELMQKLTQNSTNSLKKRLQEILQHQRGGVAQSFDLQISGSTDATTLELSDGRQQMMKTIDVTSSTYNQNLPSFRYERLNTSKEAPLHPHQRRIKSSYLNSRSYRGGAGTQCSTTATNSNRNHGDLQSTVTPLLLQNTVSLRELLHKQSIAQNDSRPKPQPINGSTYMIGCESLREVCTINWMPSILKEKRRGKLFEGRSMTKSMTYV
ncbi:hypothetical protein FGO68_gene1625 [Halteria grandinella]|uniref:Uncharacterized protein n=1 Tax=Halteria grandinella TaxID=5974 RepID=A0A8J8NZJ5_HALGN|nr:hypothetical protein FGO68_gene1625 [Halteria grandinella]